MGQEDIVMARYLSKNERFADLFNGAMFGGKQEISAQDLSEASPVYTVKDRGGRWRKPVCDVRRYLKDGGALQALAVENQSYVDYIMPLRCMEYAAAEYRSQVEKIRAGYLERTEKRRAAGNQTAENEAAGRTLEGQAIRTGDPEVRLNSDEWISGISAEDRLAPVYMIVLYWGKESWNGPRDLKDMMDFRGNKAMESEFSNYPMRLVCINEEKDCSRYRTDLQEMFEIMRLRCDRKALRNYLCESSALGNLAEDARDLLTVVLGKRILNKRKKTMKKKGKEESDMKSLIEEMMEDEREEGREEGRKEGREEGRENTERERKRADAAEREVRALKEENRRLKEMLQASAAL